MKNNLLYSFSIFFLAASCLCLKPILFIGGFSQNTFLIKGENSSLGENCPSNFLVKKKNSN